MPSGYACGSVDILAMFGSDFVQLFTDGAYKNQSVFWIVSYSVWPESPFMSFGLQNYGLKDVGGVACLWPSQAPQSTSLI